MASKRLTLHDRAEEIYEKLPRKYRDVILNAIIARSLETGELGRELSLYLKMEDAEKIISSLGSSIVKIRPKHPFKKKVVISGVDPEERKKKEMEELFSY